MNEIRRFRMQRRLSILLAVLLACLAPPIGAQSPGELFEACRYDEMVRELQRYSFEQKRLLFAFWVPGEVLVEKVVWNLPAQDAEVDEAFERLRSSLLVIVSEEVVGVLGFGYTQDETAMRAKTRLLDGEGREYGPLDMRRIDPSGEILALLVPLGAAGEGAHVLAFPGRDEKGQWIADPTREGSLTIRIGDKDFRYRFPLGSCLAPSRDPETGERFPGNYRFNPFTGRRLVVDAVEEVDGS